MRIVMSRKKCKASFTPLWLTAGKQPGKICRRAAALAVRQSRAGIGLQVITK
jgi:hypothetical protein